MADMIAIQERAQTYLTYFEEYQSCKTEEEKINNKNEIRYWKNVIDILGTEISDQTILIFGEAEKV